MASSHKTQKERILEYLQEHKHLTTLGGRNELKMMGFAARIFELRHAGHNIVTNWIYVGDVKIADYVLLPTVDEVSHEK